MGVIGQIGDVDIGGDSTHAQEWPNNTTQNFVGTIDDVLSGTYSCIIGANGDRLGHVHFDRLPLEGTFMGNEFMLFAHLIRVSASEHG